MRLFKTSLLVVSATILASAQAPVLPEQVRAAADRITAAQLAKDLEFIASDELRGRATPSPGFDAAAKFIAARLERAGLRPAGDKGTFFQHYEMHESRIDAGGAYLEVGGRRLRLGDDFVVRSFAGTPSGPLPVVYVGHGWSIPAKNIDSYAAVDVKGKIVLAHGPRAMPKGVDVRQIGRVTPGAESPIVAAAERGAAAVIYIPQSSALDGWENMRQQNLVRRELEPPVPSAYAAAPATSILLNRQAAEALLEGERLSGADLIARGDAADYPEAFELQRRVTLHLPAKVVVHRPYNVVALLEGTDAILKNEHITVEAHLDGAVGSRAVDGDSIYNSADDNASGSAAMLSIAEQMVKVPPRRSIIFIWDSGEEVGLWGTRFFVQNPPVPLDRIVAHFNIDMIGANRQPGSPDADEPRVTGPDEVYLIGPGVLSASTDALLERVNAEYLKLTFNRDFDTAESEFFYPRTDAGPFLERGILTIGFTTGIHRRYHLPADEAKYLDPRKIERIARTAFVSIHALAVVDERPRIDRAIPPTVPNYR